MTDYIRAEHGKIIIETGDGGDWELTIQSADDMAGRILFAAATAQRQLQLIEAACAGGHDWSEPVNHWTRDNRVYHCTRDGCEADMEAPGRIPFEPKPHEWNIINKGQCTGLGCYSCDIEGFDVVMDGALGLVGITRGGIKFAVAPTIEDAWKAAHE